MSSQKYLGVIATAFLLAHSIDLLTVILSSYSQFDSVQMLHRDLLIKSAALIPPLTAKAHKGSAGRIAVIGGSFEYTGAPFYAAISTLRVGADLSFILCSQSAALPIKAYSPELMVLPCLDSKSDLSKGLDRLQSVHTVVVGPGLGRDPQVMSSAKEIILHALKLDKNVLIDADGTYLFANDEELREKVKGTKTVITPNKVEFDRIYDSVFGESCQGTIIPMPDKLDKYWLKADEISPEHFTYRAVNLAKALNITILKKGKIDIITDGEVVALNDQYGSNRRCGGQGDMLSGTLGVFLAWHDITGYADAHGHVLAGFASSCLVRKANERGFAKKRRSLVAPDMIEELGESFEELFSFL